VAVQVSDQEAAKAGIAKLMTGTKYGIAFRDDYALLTTTQALADKYAAETTSLAENTQFSEDLDALGEQGVLSFWSQLGKLSELAKDSLEPAQAAALAEVKNARFSGALRFDSSYAEIAGVVTGVQAKAGAGDVPKAAMSALPASTVGALSISGLDRIVTDQWAQIEKSAIASQGAAQWQQTLDQAQTKLGVSLPADLATLVGRNLTVAVDAQNLGKADMKVGARIQGDTAKIGTLVDKLNKALTAQGTATQLTTVPGDGVYTIASAPDYAKTLAAEGTLGDTETFQTAIPNADDATFGLFVDLDKVEKLYLDGMQGADKANLQVLRAVGISGSQTDTGGTFSLRVLFN
jgi:hypothetical protein